MILLAIQCDTHRNLVRTHPPPSLHFRSSPRAQGVEMWVVESTHWVNPSPHARMRYVSSYPFDAAMASHRLIFRVDGVGGRSGAAGPQQAEAWEIFREGALGGGSGGGEHSGGLANLSLVGDDVQMSIFDFNGVARAMDDDIIVDAHSRAVDTLALEQESQE